MADVKKTELKEEVKEEVKETEKAEDKAADEKQMKASTEANRRKKAERREAKAARKEANKIEEKRNRPNNAVLAVLIFGVLIGMFAFVAGYNYFSKPESIQKYIEDNGGADSYSNLYIDEHTTANLTAEGNSIKLDVACTPHEGEEEEFIEYYKGEDGEESVKYVGAYFLTTMKPQVRGFSGDVNIIVKVGDEEVQNINMTYKEAKKFLKDLEKKAEEEANNPEAATEDEAAEAAAEAAAESVDVEDLDAEDVVVDEGDADDKADKEDADKADDKKEDKKDKE